MNRTTAITSIVVGTYSSGYDRGRAGFLHPGISLL